MPGPDPLHGPDADARRWRRLFQAGVLPRSGYRSDGRCVPRRILRCVLRRWARSSVELRLTAAGDIGSLWSMYGSAHLGMPCLRASGKVGSNCARGAAFGHSEFCTQIGASSSGILTLAAHTSVASSTIAAGQALAEAEAAPWFPA